MPGLDPEFHPRHAGRSTAPTGARAAVLCLAALACDHGARGTNERVIAPVASASTATQAVTPSPFASVLSLLTRPEVFDGREVIAIGYVDKDAQAIFLASEHAEHLLFEFGVVLRFEACPGRAFRGGVLQDSALLRAPGWVAVRGVFISQLGGSYGGLCEITHVTEYGIKKGRPALGASASPDNGLPQGELDRRAVPQDSSAGAQR